MRSCSCSCRDIRVDLSYPDVRLRVAQIYQSLLSRLFIEEPSDEADYVNGLLQDYVWAEMDTLLGATRAVEKDPNALSDEEVASLRELLQPKGYPELTPDEVVGLRSLLQPPTQRRRALPPPEEVMPDEEALPSPQPVRTAPRLQRPTNRIPMPHRGAMTDITRNQAIQAHTLAQRQGLDDA